MRSALVRTRLEVQVSDRLREPVEAAAYYVVSEALTNAAKHAHASLVDVRVELKDGQLRVSVRDDGLGGADFTRGSGLLGLKDRVEALGGHMSIESPHQVGTSISVDLPISKALPTRR